MSVFFVTLNDTIVVDSSLTAKMGKTVDACRLYLNDAETNPADVEVVKLICCAIIWIFVICAIVYILVKVFDLFYRVSSEKRKRNWDVEDRKNKRKAELLDKLLDFKKRYAEYSVVEGEKMIKDKDGKIINKEAAEYYIETLNYHLNNKVATETVPNSDDSTK